MMWYGLRTLLIVLALAMFVGAAVELYRILALAQSGARTVPTMYSEHAGLALALVCAAMIAGLLAFRRNPITAPK